MAEFLEGQDVGIQTDAVEFYFGLLFDHALLRKHVIFPKGLRIFFGLSVRIIYIYM